jgi:hypothetical protein
MESCLSFTNKDSVIRIYDDAGKVIRVDPSGHQTEIASGLFFPTGMTMGPDGALYVSNVGFGPPPSGLGEILRITVP